MCSNENDRVAECERTCEKLRAQLTRAHAAIAILYSGKTARRADGSTDVELVIGAVLGDQG